MKKREKRILGILLAAVLLLGTMGSALAETIPDGEDANIVTVRDELRRAPEYTELPEIARQILDYLCGWDNTIGGLVRMEEIFWEADASVRDETIAQCNALPQRDLSIVNSQGNRLAGTLYVPAAPSHTYIFLSHGYNMTGLTEWSRYIPHYVQLGYNVITVDHQRHGDSEGQFTGFGSQESRDCVQWLRYILSDIDPQAKFVLEGCSMGAATVMLMTAVPGFPAEKVLFLVEDCGYTSMRDELDWILAFYAKDIPADARTAIADTVMALYEQVTGFRGDDTNALAAVAQSDLPLLIMHGTDDTFVPGSMAKPLYDASASRDKSIVYYDRATHGMSQFRYPEEFFAAVQKYLDRYAPVDGAAAETYSDVTDPGEYYYAPVYWAQRTGLSYGVGDGRFAPWETCTRAQFMTFLWAAAGSPEPAEDTDFEDVADADWFRPAVCWAVEQGITAGTGETTFGPQEICTRGQAVTFLYRMEGAAD